VTASWKSVRLGDLIRIKHGWPFKSEFFSDELTGLPIVTAVGNFRYTGGFRFHETLVKEYRDKYPAEYELKAGEILLIMTCQTEGGEILGIPATVPDDGHIYLHNQRLGKVEILFPELVDSKFLYWIFLSKEFNRELVSTASGTKIVHTSPSRIEAYQFKLPPFSEQRAIAQILGALDDKIDLNRRMNETLEAMARAIFKSWFVDFDPVRAKAEGRQPYGMDAETAALFPDGFEDSALGEVPREWVQTTLGEEISFLTGYAFKSEAFSESPLGTRLARGDNVKEGFFHWETKTRFWSTVTDDITEYLLSEGDVLIGMDGSKVGKNWVKVRRCDLPCLLVQRVARLRFNQSIGENFIWLLVSDPRFREYVDAVKTGTSIPHISGGQIKTYKFIRPAQCDQRIFKKFEEMVSPLCRRIDNNYEETLNLVALRDTLLPRLLSGSVDISQDN